MNARYPLLVAVALLPAPAVASTPATVTEAIEKLDLVTMPVPEGAEIQGYRRLAKLNFTAPMSNTAAFAFVDKQLSQKGWKQIPGGQTTGDYINADYRLDGFIVHLSIMPQGPGTAYAILSHQGNIALEDVPVPKNAEKLYAFTATVMYKSPDSVEVTAKACRELLLTAGWSPYGGAGDTVYYRQNAVQVNVNVMSAPGQGGRR